MRHEIKVRTHRNRQRPHLKYIVNYREDGKRKRAYFETKGSATAFADERNIALINEGREHAEFPAALRIMAQECADKLQRFGRTIADAVDHYISHLETMERSCTVAALINELIAKKQAECRHGRPASGDYILDLNVRLGRFAKTFGQRIVATITSEEIDDWLSALKDDRTGRTLSRQSRSNYARILGVAFAFACKRRYATENRMKGIDKPRGDTMPGILTVEQTARLLEVASPEILPYLAIGAFAGLRASEIERLNWRDIDFEENEIAVSGESKTGERHVDMLPNLREWLMPLRKLNGRVTPENFRKHFDQAREAAGIALWPNNALRHSFGSYHLKHFHNDALTRLQMGHWRDSAVLFAHYRRAVTRRNAERYWNLLPAPAKNVVRLVAS
jgi:integrase